MNKIFGFLLIAAMLSTTGAQAADRHDFMNHIYDYIENLDVFELNQEEGRAYYIPQHHKLLNGQWKFMFANTPEGIPTNFYEVGFADKKWADIDVPSNWEMRGFGDAMFRNVHAPFKANPPYVPRDYNPTGAYRTTFTVPAEWSGEEVFLRFEKVASASFLWVNGHEVGYNEGAQEPAEYNITPYLKKGRNQLSGQTELYQASVLKDAVVGNADHAANRHHVLVLQHRGRNFRKGIPLQNGIRVHADKVGILCRVDAHIDAVRFTAVLFVNQRNGNAIYAAFINRNLIFAGYLTADRPLHLMQIKGVDHKLRRVVFGAVVYNNNLIGVIIQLQQRTYRLRNGHFFIIGRNNDTDGNVVIMMDTIQLLNIQDATVDASSDVDALCDAASGAAV